MEDLLRGAPSDAAQLGTATHDKLEKFFTSGIEIDTSVRSGKLAQAGLEVYPSRQSLEPGHPPQPRFALGLDVCGL